MTASALFPAPHTSLISLTCDGSTRPARVAQERLQTAEFVLHRVAQGDAEAVRECIGQFGSLIWSIACRGTCSRADAEDAVQEIFADVWRSAGRFDPAQGSEEVFITIIARRRLLDRMRHAAHGQAARTVDHIDSLCWTDQGNSASACPEAEAAGRAVMQLRPQLRMVLELGILQGLSHAEIAKALQTPIDTVKTMMTRGLIQVREFMGS